ncbi:hypothetical protein HRG_004782 [Hirsutella rhossiliensis]|uniref:Uncharacterized protein n=1 Tax=Hirsutella rhossiliensis TaxID=111463 RepID=A0A9P8SJM6_9HYPO|nr:uncharacterized protein HRG_04782 [Hirsutella rhossiliensis]KAH0964354.1 hypothetical protein HRG_04782 [Hirsutella rhossiliensis]
MRYILALSVVALLAGSGIAVPIENAGAAAQEAQDGLAKARDASHHDGSLKNSDIVQSQAKYAEEGARGDATTGNPDDPIKKLMSGIPVMMGIILNVSKTFLKDTLPHGIELALGLNRDQD